MLLGFCLGNQGDAKFHIAYKNMLYYDGFSNRFLKHSPLCHWSAKQIVPSLMHTIGCVSVAVLGCWIKQMNVWCLMFDVQISLQMAYVWLM